MKKRPTIADVAREAGVSLMTVSRVINGKPGVSEDVRQAILLVVKNLGYQPNQIARGLATTYTSSVGLVVPDNTNPFFALIARGVEETAFKEDYLIFLVNTAEDPAREKAVLNSLSQRGIDGLILCSSRLSVVALEEEISRFPAVVVLNRDLKSLPANTVTINVDDQHGAQMAIQYFLGEGRRRIAYLDGPANSTSGKRRLSGYRAALQESGISFDPKLVECCAPDTEGGRVATAALLARRPDVDAIFAFNDLVAIGAIQIIEHSGKKVPTDVAVIGVDDIPLAQIVRPQITTLNVNQRQIGSLAMRTLLDIIEGSSPLTAVRIEPHLVVREST
jgi:LacI family transcriptional regulator